MLKTIHQRKAVKALLGTTLVSLGIMAASARSASAAEIFWELRNVQGESGTYTGSFVYDVDTNIYSNIDITSSGSGLTGGDGNYLSGGALTVSSSSSSTQLFLETTIGATTRTLRLFFRRL